MEENQQQYSARAADGDAASTTGGGSRSRPRLLTPAQAAVFLTLKESTLRDYARRGVVPSVKLGRHVRFVEGDLVAHLETVRRSAVDVIADAGLATRRQTPRAGGHAPRLV